MSRDGGPAFDLVIFDLDGTLVDSLPDIAWAVNATLSRAGLKALSQQTVATFVGDGAAKLLARALAAAAAAAGDDPHSLPNHASLLTGFMENYAGRVCVDSRLYPGVAELLQQLTAAGAASAVITNKPGHLARALLEALGIAPAFSAIIGDLDGFPRKPDPSAALSIMKRHAASPARTALLGDGVPDMRLARALSCTGIAAAWGYVPIEQLVAEEPTYLASSPEAATLLLTGTAG